MVVSHIWVVFPTAPYVHRARKKKAFFWCSRVKTDLEQKDVEKERRLSVTLQILHRETLEHVRLMRQEASNVGTGRQLLRLFHSQGVQK